MNFSMKRTLFMKTLLFSAATVALFGMTACSGSDDNIIGDEPITEQPGAVKTYNVSIPATIGGDATTRAVDFGANGSTSTSTFKTTDKIYVYNQTQQAWASNGWDDYMTLAPATGNVKQTELTGALKFYWMDATTETGTIITTLPITPAVGDVLHLYYNMNLPVFSEPLLMGFYYSSGQTGSAASASEHDFAKATMKIKSIDGNATDGYTMTLCRVDDETNGTAQFQNLGSMYRQRLTFKNASNETVNPTITGLKISSKNSKLRYIHWPLGEFFSGVTMDPNYSFGISNPVIDANGDIYLALRFVDSDDSDALTLTATDSEGNQYECTKAAPTGGFQNGKYYHGAMTLNWTKQLVMPTVTGATSMNEPDANGFVGFYDEPADITFSGTSIGYYFKLWRYGTVTLDNLNATYDGIGIAFLSQNWDNKDNEIVLTGTNSITCTGSDNKGIWYNGNLKLSCTGTSATLTVTCTDNRYKGIRAQNHCYTPDSNTNASELAKTGFTVSRSDMTNNGDGTYSVTYTVAPNN